MSTKGSDQNTVNIVKDRDSLLHWFVMGAISDNGNKYFDAVTKDHKPGKNLKVEFIVNGVSLSVRELFDRMEKHMDKSVDEKAHEMVSHFFDEHLDKIKEMFDDAFEDTFTKKGD